MRKTTLNRTSIGIAVLVLVCIVVLGAFRISRRPAEPVMSARPETIAAEGETLFVQNCSECHYADSTEKKVGPGLKGLFHREELPATGRPVTEENIRKQLREPYDDMPSFADMEEGKVEDILGYLRTI